MASLTKRTKTVRKNKARTAGKSRKRDLRVALRKQRETKVDVI